MARFRGNLSQSDQTLPKLEIMPIALGSAYDEPFEQADCAFNCRFRLVIAIESLVKHRYPAVGPRLLEPHFEVVAILLRHLAVENEGSFQQPSSQSFDALRL